MIGAGLLWFGWFGFNAGSALGADDTAAVVWVNTMAATVPRPCSAGSSWRRSATVTPPRSAPPPVSSPVWSPSPRPVPRSRPLGRRRPRRRRRCGCAPRGRPEVPARATTTRSTSSASTSSAASSAPAHRLPRDAQPHPAGVDGLFYGGGFDQLWRQVARRRRGAASSRSSSPSSSASPSQARSASAITEDAEVAGIDQPSTPSRPTTWPARWRQCASASVAARTHAAASPCSAPDHSKEHRHEARHRDHQAPPARRGEGGPRGLRHPGMTISEASGYGRQRGHSEVYRGAEYTVDFVPEGPRRGPRRRHSTPRPSSTSSSRPPRPAASATARSGSIPVEDVVRVRTGERGLDAL